ncbi:hypothetical protein GOBAR_AA05413 [Gossypium barbadense]|uniref:Uncharacterized protein n=1 Tax=Gossypium barbadense TaxID=3634 RepID=A0A2P5YHY4_GOSBA|nr:hypothetical protein GOBAR_AA05413 [Gossypium barbadense]
MQETVVSKGELTLLVGDETITLQARNSGITSNIEGHIHQERRLRIEELDEWRAHKPRTHDKLKLRQNKPDTSPNQLKVGDRVLLDATDPHIVTTTLNEEIPLTVLSIFSFGTVEVSHPKFGTFKVNTGVNTGMEMEKHRRAKGKARFCFFDRGVRHARAIKPWTTIHGHGTLYHHREARRPRSHPQRDVGDRVLPRYGLQSKFGTHSLSFRKLRRKSYFRYYAHDPSLQVAASARLPRAMVMTNNDDPGTIHFRLGGLVCAKSVLEFGVALELYTNEFMEEEDMNALPRNIHISPSDITTMLHMRMIERQRGTDPSQYHLTHAIDEEDLEDIPDDVPLQHEKPSTTPPTERPVHAATSLAHLFDRLAHFE